MVRAAALSLLGFSLFTTLVLAAWFKSVDEPWGWKSVVAIFCAALGLTTSVLVWRAPSRTHVLAGLAVMLLSLARVGGPGGWGWVSFALLVITLALTIPVVRAAIVLRG